MDQGHVSCIDLETALKMNNPSLNHVRELSKRTWYDTYDCDPGESFAGVGLISRSKLPSDATYSLFIVSHFYSEFFSHRDGCLPTIRRSARLRPPPLRRTGTPSPTPHSLSAPTPFSAVIVSFVVIAHSVGSLGRLGCSLRFGAPSPTLMTAYLYFILFAQ